MICPRSSADCPVAVRHSIFVGFGYGNYFIVSVEKCTQWDSWVNLHSPTPTGSGDSEPIAEVKKQSPLCPNPTKIECLTATGQSADDLGQIITCNLWQGFVGFGQSGDCFLTSAIGSESPLPVGVGECRFTQLSH
jgi:hypothetical protein